MKGSILWADDQRALGMTFSAPLKSAGYSVEHVESGDAALSEINRTHFDASREVGWSVVTSRDEQAENPCTCNRRFRRR